MIALLLFRPDRISAQGNLVTLDYFSVVEQLQCPLLLEDNHAICTQRISWPLPHTDPT